MRFRLKFLDEALKEWQKLDKSVQQRFVIKLEKVLENPDQISARLHGPLQGLYKIKLSNIGYRLVYQILEEEVVVLVIAVGKRDRSEVYESARFRMR